jgi:hypothetical protein
MMIRWMFNVAAGVSLLMLTATVVASVGSRFAPWERVELSHRHVRNLLNNNHEPYLARITTKGLLFEPGRIVLYQTSSTQNLGPETGWAFNEAVVGRNLGAPGQWVWRADESDSFVEYAEVGAHEALVMVVLGFLPGLWLATCPRRRRAMRRRRGLCARCGYDLRGSAGSCPECGERT